MDRELDISMDTGDVKAMPTWSPDFDPRVNTNHPGLVRLIVEVEALRRSVLKIPIPPSLRKKFDRVNIIRQIKGTTGIEGNTLAEDRIGRLVDLSASARTQSGGPEAETSSTTAGASSEVGLEEREVLNADRVLHFIREEVARDSSGRVTEGLVRTLHRLTTEGCGYRDNIPGQYRNHEVEAGEYRPPEHEAVPGLMARFISFVNARETVEGYGPVVRAILAHFYLLSVHPFGDGNGRTARALEAYLLYGEGYNVRGFYSLANFIYRNRAAYVEELQAARFRHGGNLTEFVFFALRGFASELQGIQDEILAFLRPVLFRDLCRQALRDGAVNVRAWTILEYLNSDAPAGIPEEQFRSRQHHLAEGLYAGKTAKTLARDLKALLQTGLIAVRDGNLVANLDLLG